MDRVEPTDDVLIDMALDILDAQTVADLCYISKDEAQAALNRVQAHHAARTPGTPWRLKLWTAAVAAAPVNTPISKAVMDMCARMTPEDWAREGVRSEQGLAWAAQLQASGL